MMGKLFGKKVVSYTTCYSLKNVAKLQGKLSPENCSKLHYKLHGKSSLLHQHYIYINIYLNLTYNFPNKENFPNIERIKTFY